MPPRKEPCRNFQRGSCSYGERCKFLHVAPQQPKQNPFGFGNNFQSKNQQQTNSNPFGLNVQSNSQPRAAANPFGFGVQTNSQPRGANDFGSKQNQKPFENKWTRSANTNNSSSKQSDNLPVAPNHNCSDPDSCKRQIVEDFNNEKPLWLLTCYGHRKSGPCDISGDVSYEELRAAAYDDAKRGQSLMSIVEKERSMLNSKVAEFENLMRNPFVATLSTSSPNSAQFPAPPPNAMLGAQSPFPGTPSNTVLNAQSNPPSVSSFNQLGALLNTRQPTPPTNAFGQPSPLGNTFKTSNSSGPNAFSFGNSSGFFASGTQVTAPQSHQNPFAPSKNSASSERNSVAVSATSPHFPNSFSAQLPTASVAVSLVGINLTNGESKEEVSGDNSIWMKKEWKIGEIPEEPPSERYVF